MSSLTQSSTTVRSFSYDGSGNIAADTRGSTTYNYAYSKRNRSAELTIGSTVTADYTYDGLDRLAIRTRSNMTPAGTTQYVYDPAGHLIAEADSSGNTLTEYVWLDEMPLAVVANVSVGFHCLGLRLSLLSFSSLSAYYFLLHGGEINKAILYDTSAKRRK